MPVGAIIGSTVVGIGGAVLSSSAQKKATAKATEAQKDSSAQQLALLKDLYAQNTTNMQPYLNSGYGAQAVVEQLLGLKPLTADQFNKGEWYQPGTVNYNPTPPATPGTETPGTGTPAPTPAPAPDSHAWAEQALAYIMPEIGPKRTSKAMRISDPEARLRYLQGAFHSDERQMFNSWQQQHPLNATPAPAPAPTTGVPGGATNFPATPSGGVAVSTPSTGNPFSDLIPGQATQPQPSGGGGFLGNILNNVRPQ